MKKDTDSIIRIHSYHSSLSLIGMRQRGFTLIETLVAISILSLSIAATFSAVQNGIKSSTVAKDQITAFYLAQEGMEFIKNIRDENALHTLNGTNTNWLTNLAINPDGSSGPCDFGKTCMIDSPLKTVTTCSGGFGTCPNIKQDTVTGLYGYTASWPNTYFKREIQFTQISSNEINVAISISWTSRGGTKSFQATETLFNRQ